MEELTETTSPQAKDSDNAKQEPEFEKPPFFKSWKGMYWLLMINLVVLILIFYFFSRYFS